MLDKIRGKKKNDKDTPDLRSKNNKKDDSEVKGRLKEMVGKVRKDKDTKEEKKAPPERKMPRPMPKPTPKAGEKPRLKTPKKSDDKKSRLGAAAKGSALGAAMGGFGRRGRVPDDDQRTLIGAAVFGLILIIIVGAGYYFLVYAPYQDALGNAKQIKIDEVNTYFTGPLALDPRKTLLLAQIDGAVTPDQALAVDVLGPATQAWREYQNQQINQKKDPYNRVMITYAATGQKNVIIKVGDAQTLVNEADASVLSNMVIRTPDTVAIPIIISRLQAAGGLINVGNSVDVYLLNVTEPQNQNQTNETQTKVTNESTPNISGATVLAILRARDSGVVTANKSHAQDVAINNLIQSSSQSESASNDVEQLLRAAASRNWDESVVSQTLYSYGWRLSDFERTSNLGELDAQYLLLLEVPREDAIFLIRNMNNVILTVPTQQAPDWMIRELKAIYG
jgi:hypothetical protein